MIWISSTGISWYAESIALALASFSLIFSFLVFSFKNLLLLKQLSFSHQFCYFDLSLTSFSFDKFVSLEDFEPFKDLDLPPLLLLLLLPSEELLDDFLFFDTSQASILLLNENAWASVSSRHSSSYSLSSSCSSPLQSSCALSSILKRSLN